MSESLTEGSIERSIDRSVSRAESTVIRMLKNRFRMVDCRSGKLSSIEGANEFRIYGSVETRRNGLIDARDDQLSLTFSGKDARNEHRIRLSERLK